MHRPNIRFVDLSKDVITGIFWKSRKYNQQRTSSLSFSAILSYLLARFLSTNGIGDSYHKTMTYFLP